MKEAIRVFVALPILKLQDEILNIQKKYSNLPVRWISPHNLHITLIPPWYENNIEQIKNKLKLLENKFFSFKINFNLINYGPNVDKPRLIWASGDTPADLLKLKDAIFDILNKKPEKRSFLLHLTLARFNFNNRLKLAPLNIKIFWEEEIKEFVLMQSQLFKTGAEYKILERIKLKNPNDA